MSICPGCSSSDILAPVHVFTARQAAQHFVLSEEHPQQHAELCKHIKALWQSSECEIHECRACGLRYAWPFIAGDGQFYNLAYPYSEYPRHRWEFEQTVVSISEDPPESGYMLEIGAGFGFFLRKISPEFVEPKKIIAVEYNNAARSKLESAGYTASGDDIRNPSFDIFRGRVSVVFMFQVLEHMDHLDSVMGRLKELLRPTGRVYLAVPNGQRIDFNEKHDSLFDMPPNHISRWTECSIRAFAQRAGWLVHSFQIEPLRWRDLVREDLIFSHMKRAQRSGSLANRLRAKPRSRARVAAEGTLALLATPMRLGSWYAAHASNSSLGNSIFAQLRMTG